MKELIEAEVPFHELVMGIERGVRYLINDVDPKNGEERAVAINLVRDAGFPQ